VNTQQTDPAERSLIFEIAANVARIRFNRPKVLNAIDRSLAVAFLDACRTIASDESVRVVVLSGEGRAFMAGGDLGQFRSDPHSIPDTLIRPMHEGLLLLTRHPAPVIASVHGAVAGAGLSLAAACDLTIAAEGTQFNLAYASVGVSSDMGASWSLPRILGLRRALQLALANEVIGTDEALRIGLVNYVVPMNDLASRTYRLSTQIAAAPPLAIGAMKRLMRESGGRDLAAQLDAEREAFRHCCESEDFNEAVAAFFEKRQGRYEGR
jgi:2-(1,2-epoxy-1,2-dihydrophenyl)acetyl-CoA isomerase